MKEFTKLIITSGQNEDWTGKWYRDEVEQEMNELDNKPTSDTDWICWVLGHVFDTKDYTGDIETAILNPHVHQMMVKFDGCYVNIEKE